MSAEQADQQKQANTAALTVLVVEDFDETRFMLKFLLESSGYRVVEAVDGRQAIEAAQREHPDLILMDISLPVLDGIAATRCIREDARLREIPIVAVTAHISAEYRDQALAAGCNEYVPKPIDFDLLESVLNRFLA